MSLYAKIKVKVGRMFDKVDDSPLHEKFSDPTLEIRLLEVEDDTAADIRWKMKIALLEDNPRFTALSYVWGDPAKTERITVNGQKVEVTANLASALRHVRQHWEQEVGRHSQGKFRLWADALCINQSDVHEKNHQVPLMRSIYSSAELVICWLGPADSKIRLAFEMIRLLHNEWTRSSTDELLTFDWIRRHPSLHTTPENEYPMNHRWEAVQYLAQLNYWRRTWILQEVVLGKRTIIASGKRATEWSLIRDVVRTASMLSGKITNNGIDWPTWICPEVWKAIKNVPVSWAAILFFSIVSRDQTGQPNIELTKSDWLRAVVAGRILQATNPKDHVYGLMGIFPIRLVPDYSNSTPVSTIYRDYIGVWLRNWEMGLCGDLEELYFLLYSGVYLESSELKLPSWAPNFPVLSKHRQAVYDGKRQFGEFITDGHADRSVFPPDTEGSSIVDMSLFVSGIDLGPVVSFENYGNEMSRVSTATTKYLRQFISEEPTYPNGSPSLQMVFRLFCRKSYGMGRPLDARGLVKALGFVETLLGLDPDEPALRNELRKRNLGGFGLIADDAVAFATSFMDAFAPHDPSVERLEILDILHRWHNSSGGISSSEMGYDDDHLAILISSCLYYLQEANQGAHHVIFKMGRYIGISARGIQVGDRVCVLKESNTLSVLRMTPGNEKYYIHVAPCFIVGLMNGEAKRFLESGHCKVQRIEIR
ncbi:heterokaryon incompatibility protein-domain-containing protein [Annulohypoxylon truncatum]|uniref:heterokaryon incompatibility protein-domain-containing protein n=1 Tax=Annulohypoxylon truncatum TaxID=327061 RepID=UPI002007BDF3|nr:heterokaryon incompatibility protein-domain-containing protein [Annulohypoxylon truncatum]KAI1211521.1 heterokaryon incompatibility protein-domain-containing protein [Annulohypoxylon truncatum]